MLPVFAGSISFGQVVIYNMSNSVLPENRVTDLTYDSLTKNLWVGTEYGVVKIDSLDNWSVYNSTNSGITDNYIRCITIHENKAWIGTLSGGIFIFDGITWTNINSTNSGLTEDGVRDIQFDYQNNMWVATTGGLFYYDDTTWTTWNVFNSSFFTNNISFVRFHNKEKHVGTVNGGLNILDSVNNHTLYTSFNSGLPDNTIPKAEFDAAGNLWMASPAGGIIVHHTGDNWTQYTPSNSAIPSISFNDIFLKDNKQYMVSLDKGLVIYDGSNFESWNTANSDIPEDHLLCLSSGRDSSLWLGSYSSGLIRLNRFTLNAIKESAVANSISFLKTNPVISGESIDVNPSIIKITGKLYLCDNTGKFINFHYENGKIIPQNYLPGGIYILRYSDENLILNEKLIIVNRQ